ncbi:hypothetical protein NESM_000311200 [Novymonas esmeraldas]|uniref:Uncharacterized protein n=1 Tax=Novymonas esmeraldas TaxID=1808958 RepID=A0AAW0EIL9_9TRYP
MFSSNTFGTRSADLRSTLLALHSAHYQVDEDVTAVLLHADFRGEALRGEYYATNYLRHRLPLLFQLALYSWQPRDGRQKPAATEHAQQPSHTASGHSPIHDGDGRDTHLRSLAEEGTSPATAPSTGSSGTTTTTSISNTSSSTSASSARDASVAVSGAEQAATQEQLALLAVQVLCGDRSRVREGSSEASTASCGPVWDAHTVRCFFAEHRRLVRWTRRVLSAAWDWVECVVTNAVEDQLIAPPPPAAVPRSPLRDAAAAAPTHRVPTSAHTATAPPRPQRPQQRTATATAAAAAAPPVIHVDVSDSVVSCASSTSAGADPLRSCQSMRRTPTRSGSSGAASSAPLTPQPSQERRRVRRGVATRFTSIAELEAALGLQCRRIRHAIMLLESLVVAIVVVPAFLFRRSVEASPSMPWLRRDPGRHGHHVGGMADVYGTEDEDEETEDEEDDCGGVGVGALRLCGLCESSGATRTVGTTRSFFASRHLSDAVADDVQCEPGEVMGADDVVRVDGLLDVTGRRRRRRSERRRGRGRLSIATSTTATSTEAAVDEAEAAEPPLDVLVRHTMRAFTDTFLSITAVQQRLQEYSHERRHIITEAPRVDAVAPLSESSSPWTTAGSGGAVGVATSSSSATASSAAKAAPAWAADNGGDLSASSSAALVAARGTSEAYACPACQRFHEAEELLLDAVQGNLEVLKKSAIAVAAHHSAIAEEAIRTVDAEGVVFASQATMLLAHVLVPEVLAAHPPGSRGGMALEWVINYVFGGCSGADVRQHRQQRGGHGTTGVADVDESVDCFSLANSSRSSASAAARSTEASDADTRSDGVWRRSDTGSRSSTSTSGRWNVRNYDCDDGDEYADAPLHPRHSDPISDDDDVDNNNNKGSGGGGGGAEVEELGEDGDSGVARRDAAEVASTNIRVEYVLAACFTRCHPLMTVIGCVAENNQYNCGRTVAHAVLQYAFTLSQTSARLLRTPLLTSRWSTPFTEAMMRGLTELAAHANHTASATPLLTPGARAAGAMAGGLTSAPMTLSFASSSAVAAHLRVPQSVVTTAMLQRPRHRVYAFVPPPAAVVTGSSAADEGEVAQLRTLRRCMAMHWAKCVLLSARTLTRAGTYDVSVPYEHYVSISTARQRLRERMLAYRRRMEAQFKTAHDEVRLSRLREVFERWERDEQSMAARDAEVAEDASESVAAAAATAMQTRQGTPVAPALATGDLHDSVAVALRRPEPSRGGSLEASVHVDAAADTAERENHRRAFVDSFCFGKSDLELLSANLLRRSREPVLVPVHVIAFTSLFSILDAMGDVLLSDQPRLSAVVANELLTLLYEAQLSMLEPLHDGAMAVVGRTGSATSTSATTTPVSSLTSSFSLPPSSRSDSAVGGLCDAAVSPASSPAASPRAARSPALSPASADDLVAVTTSSPNVDDADDDDADDDDVGGAPPPPPQSRHGARDAAGASGGRRHLTRTKAHASAAAATAAAAAVVRDGHILLFNEYALLLEAGLRSASVVRRWHSEVRADANHAARGYVSLLYHLQQRQEQWADATQDEYLVSRSTLRLMLGVTARDARGNVHGNILHVDDLDITGSRKEEVAPRLGVTSSKDSLAATAYSEEWDPAMVETTEPVGSPVRAVVAYAPAPPPMSLVAAEALPQLPKDAGCRWSTDLLVDAEPEASDAPLVDVWSISSADRVSVDRFDGRHRVHITPSRIVATPLTTLAAGQGPATADEAETGRAEAPSAAVHSPTVPPSQLHRALLPRQSSFDCLSLVGGTLRMHDQGVLAAALTQCLRTVPPPSPATAVTGVEHNSDAVDHLGDDGGVDGGTRELPPLVPCMSGASSNNSSFASYTSTAVTADVEEDAAVAAVDGGVAAPWRGGPVECDGVPSHAATADADEAAAAPGTRERHRRPTRVVLAGGPGDLAAMVSRIPQTWALHVPPRDASAHGTAGEAQQSTAAAAAAPDTSATGGAAAVVIRHAAVEVAPSAATGVAGAAEVWATISAGTPAHPADSGDAAGPEASAAASLMCCETSRHSSPPADDDVDGAGQPSAAVDMSSPPCAGAAPRSVPLVSVAPLSAAGVVPALDGSHRTSTPPLCASNARSPCNDAALTRAIHRVLQHRRKSSGAAATGVPPSSLAHVNVELGHLEAAALPWQTAAADGGDGGAAVGAECDDCSLQDVQADPVPASTLPPARSPPTASHETITRSPPITTTPTACSDHRGSDVESGDSDAATQSISPAAAVAEDVAEPRETVGKMHADDGTRDGVRIAAPLLSPLSTSPPAPAVVASAAPPLCSPTSALPSAGEAYAECGASPASTASAHDLQWYTGAGTRPPPRNAVSLDDPTSPTALLGRFSADDRYLSVDTAALHPPHLHVLLSSPLAAPRTPATASAFTFPPGVWAAGVRIGQGGGKPPLWASSLHGGQLQHSPPAHAAPISTAGADSAEDAGDGGPQSASNAAAVTTRQRHGLRTSPRRFAEQPCVMLHGRLPRDMRGRGRGSGEQGGCGDARRAGHTSTADSISSNDSDVST